MKKTWLFSIVLLSLLALTIVPLTRSAASKPDLKYSATPVQVQFEEAADLAPLEAAGTYVPYDVDIVNGELFPDGGEGIYVAIIDTGLVDGWQNFLPPTAYIRDDLGKGWSYDVVWNSSINDFDWTPNPDRGFITKAYEGDGHGTHLASTIVGYQRSTIGVPPHIVRGVAPGATIIPLLGLDTWLVDTPASFYDVDGDGINDVHAGKVLFRGGDDWMLTSAIYYVADLAEANGWKIIVNNSWGSSAPSPLIREAIDYAISKGVIFVFSAGNRGMAGMGWPGAYPEVISAAAGGWTMQMVGYPPSNPPGPPYRWYLSDVPEKLNTNDALGNNWQIYLGEFSGRPNPALGQSWKDLDVCAPGCYVVGPWKPEALWDGTAWINLNAPPAYYGLWGTSMAVPHVVGVAAIVAQYYPTVNQYSMELVLKKAAVHIPLNSATEYAYDPFYGPAFYCNDHDAGSGWLTVDWAVYMAFEYFGTGTWAERRR